MWHMALKLSKSLPESKVCSRFPTYDDTIFKETFYFLETLWATKNLCKGF